MNTRYPVACDVSQWNPPLDDTYPRRAVIFRGTFGSQFLDPKYRRNAEQVAALYRAGKIDGAIVYAVYLGNQSVQSQYQALWRVIGPKVPDWLMGVMLDVESWGGTDYAIHGDHSTQLNQWWALNAHRMGSWHGSLGYGNRGDLASIWPRRDKRAWVIEAKYGSTIRLDVPGAIGQQYTDGQSKWGVPAGMPTASAPFGHCDHNAFPGVTSMAALREQMRPSATSPAKPIARKPAPRPDRPFYPYTPLKAFGAGLVSPNGHHLLMLADDASVHIHTDGHDVRSLA